MPGVIGCGGCPFFAAHEAGVSAKLKNSYSTPVITSKPMSFARFNTRVSACRGQSGCGEPSAFTKLPRKDGTPLSHGTLRCVFRSSRTIASGNPLCQPVTCVLSYG